MRLPFSISMREPDLSIGGTEQPYLRRWWITSRHEDRWRLYLHQFLRDDDDRALHDHPAASFSLILRGGYIEHLPGGVVKHRRPGMVIFRRAAHAHRIELYRDAHGNPVPAWTLFMFAPNVREWGFHCPNGWRHWSEFTAPGDSTRIGKGCD